MTIHSSIALILIAGIVGAFVGRAVPRNVPNSHTAPNLIPSVPSSTADRCNALRTALASTKTQLAICTAFNVGDSDTKTPSDLSAVPPTDPQRIARDAQEIRQNRKLLKTYSEAVIVQHSDGRTGVYRPDEWPIDGDGVIVARKLASGDIAWYSGPDAGPRSDPAAFQTLTASPDFVEPIIETAPDGTILVNGEPADNTVQRMFGGKVKPEQEEAP